MGRLRSRNTAVRHAQTHSQCFRKCLGVQWMGAGKNGLVDDFTPSVHTDEFDYGENGGRKVPSESGFSFNVNASEFFPEYFSSPDVDHGERQESTLMDTVASECLAPDRENNAEEECSFL